MFWPPTGHPDQRWTDDPWTEAWVKSARRVSELYEQALGAADLRAPFASIRFMSFPADPGVDAVRVEVGVDRPESWEAGRVHVPRSIGTWSPGKRARAVFDVIDGALRLLAPHRSWPLEVVDDVGARVLEQELRFRWESDWKVGPDRRTHARAVFRLLDEGYGRVALEVGDRTTGELVARSEEVLAYSTSAGFKRSAATLRWREGRVEIDPFVSIVGASGVAFALDPTTGRIEPPGTDEPDPEGEPAAVELVASRWIPDRPEIRVVGGGPMNGVPDAYREALDEALLVATESLTGWWSGADRPLLEIWYSFEESDAEVPTVRRATGKVVARLRRHAVTMRESPDPAALARRDVADLLDLVGVKLGLGPRPSGSSPV